MCSSYRGRCESTLQYGGMYGLQHYMVMCCRPVLGDSGTIPPMLSAIESQVLDGLDVLLGNEILALLCVITLGLLLGRIRVGGVSLGSSGVIFTSLLLGMLGYQIPGEMATLGLIVFAYCVGLSAGPRFFRILKRDGRSLAALCAILVVTGAVTAGGLGSWLDIPPDLVAGIFAGALTSTPGFAAATEALPAGSQVAVGFGVAYPIGVITIVLFVQLAPRVARIDLAKLGKKLESLDEQERRICRVLVQICNPAVFGKRLSDLPIISDSNCQVARILEGDRLVPLPSDLVLAQGQRLLLIARAFRLPPIVDLLGQRDQQAGLLMDVEGQSIQVVVGSRELADKTLDQLSLRSRFGVTITRITRHDLEFVPKQTDAVEYGDMLRAVGERKDLNAFASFAGHRSRSFDETDLISVAIGILAGVGLGSIKVSVGANSFSLGMVGGLLCSALVLAHFGRIGPVKGHIPAAARLLMTEVGLILFLAGAGVTAGGTMDEVLRAHGLRLCLVSFLVATLPIIVGTIFARRMFGMNLLEILGAVCGGMTSTPGLGALMAKTDSGIPVVSYTTAYPIALIAMTLCTKALVRAML